MKFWRLLPVLIFAGVLMAATIAIAAEQDIDEAHNFAAEGEEDARSCGVIEVEYGQTNGHVDRVKLNYTGPDTHDGPECEGEYVNIEIHGPAHQIMRSCGPVQMGVSPTSCTFTPIPNAPAGGPISVANIDHINLVVTDLN